MVQMLDAKPLKLMWYNADAANLATHGLHPRWLHTVVNLPMLFGPLLGPVALGMCSSVSRQSVRDQTDAGAAGAPSCDNDDDDVPAPTPHMPVSFHLNLLCAMVVVRVTVCRSSHTMSHSVHAPLARGLCKHADAVSTLFVVVVVVVVVCVLCALVFVGAPVSVGCVVGCSTPRTSILAPTVRPCVPAWRHGDATLVVLQPSTLHGMCVSWWWVEGGGLGPHSLGC